LKPNETSGLDASVVKITHQGISKDTGEPLYLLSTTDFFYPLIDDPYEMGKIACANVLSDLYAMGVVDVDTMLMTLSVSREMAMDEQDYVTSNLIRGFNDLSKEAGTNCTGRQTVMNPWPIVGGVAMSVLPESKFIRPDAAVPGDAIVLTKPLGTQLAVNAHQWKHTKPDRFQKLLESGNVTEADVDEAMAVASASMSRLNRNGAKLMHKYDAHAATDVTGFGILGHLKNLASSQNAKVDMELHTLPMIKKMKEVDEFMKGAFRLVKVTPQKLQGG